MKFQEFMERSLLIKLHQRYQLFLAPLRRELKSQDLGLHEALILLALFFEKSELVFPQTLSLTLHLPKDQVSQALKQLSQRRLVELSIASQDRRKRTISLTRKGLSLAPRLVALFDHWETNLENEKAF